MNNIVQQDITTTTLVAKPKISGIEINGIKTDIIGPSLYSNGVCIGSAKKNKGLITLSKIGACVVSHELTPCEFDKLRDKQHAKNKQKI